MREIRPSGLMRGEAAAQAAPLLLDWMVSSYPYQSLRMNPAAVERLFFAGPGDDRRSGGADFVGTADRRRVGRFVQQLGRLFADAQ
jgi:hypothetical protein